MVIEDPEKFMHYHLMADVEKLSPSTLKQWQGIQRKVSERDESVKGQIAKMKADTTTVDDVAAEIGLNKNAKPGSPNRKAYEDFYREATKYVREISSQRNTPLSPEEQTAIVRGLGKEVVFKRRIFDDKKKVYQVEFKDLTKEQSARAASLLPKGIPATEENILKAFKAIEMRNANR
jgi:hypothetical protein